MANEKELHFVLSKKIEHNAFTGCIIYAQQREGKSSYALQCMYDIYQDWETVFDRTFFKLEDIIKFLKQAVTHNEIIPCILWDDASVYGGSVIWFKSRDKAGYLQALFDVIGSKVKGILLTTPNPSNLLKSIRSYEFYRIKITKADSLGGRIATGYKNIMLPSGTRNIRKEFQDRYKVNLPDNVYARYNALRQSYLEEAVRNLDACMVESALSGEEGMSLKEQIADEGF